MRSAPHGLDSGIIESIPDITLTSVRRFAGEDGRFVVDESIITGHVHGEWAGMAGGGAPVEVRMLHVFEIRTSDELVARLTYIRYGHIVRA